MSGLVDVSNMQVGDKQNSNLTSNVDSVMNYMGVDKKDDVSQQSNAVVPAADGSEYRIDLRLLNAELNADYSDNSIARIKNMGRHQQSPKKPGILPQESTGANDVFSELD